MKIAEQIAIQTYRSHRDKFEPLKERWLDLVDRYENKLRDGSISSQTESKIALGEAYSLVENAIPRLLARQPKYRYLARGREDTSAEIYDEFSEYQWQEAGVQQKLKEVAKWGLITGLSGWRMGWKEEKKIFRKRTKEIMGIEVTNRLLESYAKTKIKDEEEVVSNYTFDPIKPFDLIWSPEAVVTDDCRVIGYKTRMVLGELKAQGYKTADLAYDIRQSDEWKKRMEENDGISNYQQGKLIEETDIEIAELYVRTVNNGTYEYNVITLGTYGEDNVEVLRSEENKLDRKFAPLGIFTPVNRPGKLYGFGLIEPVIGILDAAEDSINMGIEALWTDVARPMEYNPNNVLAPNSIKYGSRVLIPVKQLGASVAVMATPTPNMNGIQYINDFLTKSKQNVSGITDFQTGADQLGGAKTLGEIQIKTQESNARIQMIMDNLEKQVIEPMGKYALWMNQQFLDGKILYRVLGKKGRVLEKNIKSKDIEAVKDVVVISGSSMLASQQAEIQKWTLLLNQAYAEAGQAEPVQINRETIWENLLEQGIQVKDVESYLPNAKEEEEKEVGGQMIQLEDAKEENANPLAARVLPTDDPEIHFQMHQAEIKAREAEIQQNPDERKVQELQILIQHLNDHTQSAGGPVPPYSQGMQVGQGTSAEAPMEQVNQ